MSYAHLYAMYVENLTYAKQKLSYANIQTTTVFNIYQPTQISV